MSLARHPEAAPKLWIHLTGPMQIVDATGVSLLPKSRKARAVLAILALASPRPVSRLRITGLLWSQREREQARGSLRQCVHEIQGLFQALGPGVLEADREQLRIADDIFWLDVRDAAAEPTGTFLEDVAGLDPAFDDWVRIERSGSRVPYSPPRDERAARIGVRHLRGLGGEHEAALAEGLGAEIAAALSRFRWMPSVAPGALAFGSSEVELEYVLDGSVRRVGNHIRVALRVQDMRSGGEVVWARNFDGTIDDLLSFYDGVVEQTAAQVDAELLVREGGRAAGRVGDGVTSAPTLTLAAIPAIFRLEREGFNRAGRMLEEAISIAPESPMAHAWLAYWHVIALGQGWAVSPQTAAARAGKLAEHALMLDSADARALTIAGHVKGFLDKQVDEALALHERALALNPALSWAWMLSGLAHAYAGDHPEAIRRIEVARRLSPFDPSAFFFDMSLTMPYLLLGEYERAAELGRLTSQIKPSFSSSWKGLLAALGHLGRTEEAAEVRARLGTLEPGFSVSEALRRSPLRRPDDLSRYAEGMRLGGLEE